MFPSIYKHLVRWLKTAGLGSQHTMDTIMTQLTSHISWGMSPHAFLAHYLQPPSVAQVRYTFRITPYFFSLIDIASFLHCCSVKLMLQIKPFTLILRRLLTGRPGFPDKFISFVYTCFGLSADSISVQLKITIPTFLLIKSKV